MELDTAQTITAIAEMKKLIKRMGRRPYCWLRELHHSGAMARPIRKTVVVRATFVSVVWKCLPRIEKEGKRIVEANGAVNAERVTIATMVYFSRFVCDFGSGRFLRRLMRSSQDDDIVVSVGLTFVVDVDVAFAIVVDHWGLRL